MPDTLSQLYLVNASSIVEMTHAYADVSIYFSLLGVLGEMAASVGHTCLQIVGKFHDARMQTCLHFATRRKIAVGKCYFRR